jgi:3-oxoacid CoA-transferase
MEHCSKAGTSKILKNCSLPLTGKNVVSLIITELAVFEVSPTEGLTLIEKVPEMSLDDIKAKTDAPFKVSPNLIDMQF